MTDHLEELKQLCEGATKGPWETDKGHTSLSYVTSPDGKICSCYWMHGKTEMPVVENTAFIAASREALPALIALVEEIYGMTLKQQPAQFTVTDIANAVHKFRRGE